MLYTILLVDDEEELLENITYDLRSGPYIFRYAYNGEEAISMIKSTHIDCVITDIKMPVKTGLVMAKEARDYGFTRPIIFLTAHGDEKLMREALLCNAHDFINKPYKEEEINMVVQEALENYEKDTKPNIENFEKNFKSFLKIGA